VSDGRRTPVLRKGRTWQKSVSSRLYRAACSERGELAPSSQRSTRPHRSGVCTASRSQRQSTRRRSSAVAATGTSSGAGGSIATATASSESSSDTLFGSADGDGAALEAPGVTMSSGLAGAARGARSMTRREPQLPAQAAKSAKESSRASVSGSCGV